MYKVVYEEDINEIEDDNSETDSASEYHHEFHIHGIVYDKNYPSDVFYDVDDPPQKGDRVYFVYAIYTYGDSFTTHHGGGFMPIYITKNKKYAEKVKREVENSEKGATVISTEISIPGQKRKIKIDTPWNDWFGSLDSVEIRDFIVR